MTTKATKKSKKIRKGKTGSRIFACRFSGFVAGLRCRRRCQAQIHLWRIFAYGKNKENQQQKQKDRKKVQFIVTREFSGSQTMREAFEQLIERQACGQFEEWLGKKPAKTR